mmetsp:Transcript_15478/g.48858  ORF Transcript_15478/g.48858 Transcript_15478/m.48858 type:complete len:266 (-) Transcript_15478:26-823(-)
MDLPSALGSEGDGGGRSGCARGLAEGREPRVPPGAAHGHFWRGRAPDRCLRHGRVVLRRQCRARLRPRGAVHALEPRGVLRPRPRELAAGQDLLPARQLHGRAGALRQQVLQPLGGGVEGPRPPPAPDPGAGVQRTGAHGQDQEGPDERQRGCLRGLRDGRVDRLRAGRAGLPECQQPALHVLRPRLLLPEPEGTSDDPQHRGRLRPHGLVHRSRVRAAEGPGSASRLCPGDRRVPDAVAGGVGDALHARLALQGGPLPELRRLR